MEILHNTFRTRKTSEAKNNNSPITSGMLVHSGIGIFNDVEVKEKTFNYLLYSLLELHLLKLMLILDPAPSYSTSQSCCHNKPFRHSTLRKFNKRVLEMQTNPKGKVNIAVTRRKLMIQWCKVRKIQHINHTPLK